MKQLYKFKHLFYGTLGHWNTEPVDLELKNEDVKPHHSKPYPVPYSQEKKLKEEVSFPLKIAIDENLRKSGNLDEILEVADLLIIKVAPMGGVSACLELIEKVDIPVVVSSALESSVGISAGVALAALLPVKSEPPLPFGLGTVALLEGDVVSNPLLPVNGKIKVEKVEIDLSQLKKYSVSESRKIWWHQRIADVYSLGS